MTELLINSKEDDMLRALKELGPTLSPEFMECLTTCLPKAYDENGQFDGNKYDADVKACVAEKIGSRAVFMAGVVVGIIIGVAIMK